MTPPVPTPPESPKPQLCPVAWASSPASSSTVSVPGTLPTTQTFLECDGKRSATPLSARPYLPEATTPNVPSVHLLFSRMGQFPHYPTRPRCALATPPRLRDP